MNHGTTASLICPACGQAFLTMQQGMDGMAQCPHCAHAAPRAHFGTSAQVAGVAQVRRRVAHAQPLEAPPQQWPAAAPAPQFQPSFNAAAPPPPPPAAPWQSPQAAAPPVLVRAPLQHSQALMPLHAPPPPQEFTVPEHLRPNTGRNVLLLLILAGVCAAGVWIWWDHAHAPLPAPAAGTSADAVEVRKATIPLPPPPPPVKVELLDTQAYAADAKALVTDFFAATTPEGRAACVHDAAKHSAEIEALFGPDAAKKIELRQLAHIPSVLLTLPQGRHVPLFKLITSHCPNGALLRLETGEDGKRRIYWPLLMETHENKLAAFLQQPEAQPAWFHVALRPSHGLDLSAELRPKYLTFDVQTSAASEPHLVACVERDTPLGRFMDRESDWGRVYMARLLVTKLNVQAEAPCMIVVDCEGAVER